MPQHTVEAFRWTGTGYNSQYNTSYTAVIDDDDGSYQGSGDANETISINGGAFNASNGAPYLINVSFTDTSGTSHVEPFYFFSTSGPPSGWYFIPEPGSAFTVGATLGTYQSHTVGWDYDAVTCFVNGTLIETDTGPVRVEDLCPGDQVLTADGFHPLRINLSTGVSARRMGATEALRPVVITAGALGGGLPKRDLLVSRQHRMLLNSAIARRMFGERRVLVAAIRLTDLPGIYVAPEPSNLSYHHLVFDRHQVVYAEGAASESFYPGPEAIRTLNGAARHELLELFPDLDPNRASGAVPPPAFPIPERKRQINLVRRHKQNDQPMVAA